ncbi:MAG: NfeD family protein [Bacilli bacterium]|nr:NfeD family protein [Bacilli bacterium]MDD4808530.1 NfeD family protein [Bacilli bacterium]
MNYIWLAIVVLLLLIELITLDYIAIWFATSSLIALIISNYVESFFVQFLCFILIGTGLLVFFKPFAVNFLLKKKIDKYGKNLLNQTGIVTKSVNYKEGQVKIDERLWSVTSNKRIKIGSKVKVTNIDGIKITVEEEQVGNKKKNNKN